MNDTPEHVQRLYRRMLLGRSGADRMRMASEMFDTARAFVRAGCGDSSGHDDSAEMRVRLFLRTYGDDFDARTRDRIVAHLRQSGRRRVDESTDR